MAGDAKGSRMIELIESGDMPRGGAKVTPEELELLCGWINAGAKFDGPDSAAPITSFATAGNTPASPGAGRPRVRVVAAGENDEVQFARFGSDPDRQLHGVPRRPQPARQLQHGHLRAAAARRRHRRRDRAGEARGEPAGQEAAWHGRRADALATSAAGRRRDRKIRQVDRAGSEIRRRQLQHATGRTGRTLGGRAIHARRNWSKSARSWRPRTGG